MVVQNSEVPDDNKDSWKTTVADFIEVLDPSASTVQSFTQPSAHFFKQKIQNGKFNWNFEKIKDSAGDLTPQLELFRRKTIQRVQAMDKPLQSIFFHNSSVLDKSFYTFTLFNIFAVGLILGRFPEWFHVYYTVMLLVLMPVRFYTYYKTNNHYFLADLCYFVNGMCLIYIWVLPHSVHLYQTCFAFTFGTLSFAVITWRNSIVVHSLDRITSCFIHIMPPVTMYAITHLLGEDLKAVRFPAASQHGSPAWTLKTNVFYTSIYYLIWQSSYHYFITLRKKEKIRLGKRMTSFEYLTTHKFKDLRFVKLPSPWPMILYTLFQYLYQLGSMILCVVWFKHRIAAGMFLLFIFLCAGRNGASYYIDYYGKRFEKELNMLRMQVDSLTQQVNEKSSSSGMSTSAYLDSQMSSVSSSISDELLWEMKLSDDEDS
ncbi:glycerophosphocholine acyltransferase Ecym_1423 [Eremothecium cymbalariae DBVPG|uniref:Glycerophosphocholine acyltransferase 1 n=1 Tax=Eremothecium cymbalariae (strain CBS 270.75 / DBVPG 7215 / KCTC 17166 / NRRL Y-17582) TaxID=931890 RepID=G8JM80_ERECY|nr:hypothetical protein Ecym_1423 [Eremothecium cymbalariae DBVPG\